MSRSQKSVGACLAILLASSVALSLRGIADDAINQSDTGDRVKSDSPHDPPRSRTRPRGADVPLAHALLKREEDSREEKLVKALDKPTNVEWQELALEDCVTYLAEFHGIAIWIDKTALTEEGVGIDQPITLRLQGVRLDSVLNLLLEPLLLDWLIQDEVLKITTRVWCDANPEIRTYEIQNLIAVGHEPAELIASITNCVEPDSWKGKNAFAGIAHTGGVLVVRQTQRSHAEISRLLAELDDIAEADADQHGGADKGAVVSVKVYQTGDQPAEKLAESLQDFVEAGSWKNHGGKGEVLALEGKIVVRQSAHVHRSIQRFLAQLEAKPGATSPDPQRPSSPAAPGAAADPFRVLKPVSSLKFHGRAQATARQKKELKERLQSQGICVW